jgi:hypothetical protein
MRTIGHKLDSIKEQAQRGDQPHRVRQRELSELRQRNRQPHCWQSPSLSIWAMFFQALIRCSWNLLGHFLPLCDRVRSRVVPHRTWFNDLPNVPSSPVASVVIFSGADRVASVALKLKDGTSFSHGGTGGTDVSLNLGSAECWTQTKLCTGQYNNHIRISYIQATTSAGNALETGASTAD